MSNAEFLIELVTKMADQIHGVKVKSRAFRLKTYKNCFIASEAIDWMMENVSPPLTSRQQAISIGTEMIRTNFIRHVVDEHFLFADKKLFFKFQREKPAAQLLYSEDGSSIDLRELVRMMCSNRYGLVLDNRKYHLKTYKMCFLGTEATDWLAENLLIKRSAAVSIGQFLLTQDVIRHVANDKPFVDEKYFYAWGSAADKTNCLPGFLDVDESALAQGTNSALVTSLAEKMSGRGTSVQDLRETAMATQTTQFARDNGTDTPTNSESSEARQRQQNRQQQQLSVQTWPAGVGPTASSSNSTNPQLSPSDERMLAISESTDYSFMPSQKPEPQYGDYGRLVSKVDHASDHASEYSNIGLILQDVPEDVALEASEYGMAPPPLPDAHRKQDVPQSVLEDSQSGYDTVPTVLSAETCEMSELEHDSKSGYDSVTPAQ